MVLRLGMFSYGRLVREVFEARVLVLPQTYFESTCSLVDILRLSYTTYYS